MEYTELVKKITEDVVKQLKEIAQTEQVLIIAEKGCPGVKPVLETLGENVSVCYPEDVTEEQIGVVRRIVPFITCSQMVDLSLGRADGKLMIRVLKELLNGNKVEIFKYEYTRYKETAAPALFEHYLAYAEKLKSFGMIPLGKKVTEKAELKVQSKTTDKRLITENDVFNAKENGVKSLTIRTDACITPLAAETARNHGIELIRVS